MTTLSAPELRNLLVVAGHAVYLGDTASQTEDDHYWSLQSFQRGEPRVYVEHVRAGVELAARDPATLLVFSGGPSRLEAGLRSEAQGYWNIAQQHRWWSNADLPRRVTLEEFARDSFENLLFSICRFHEVTSLYPARVTVVSWKFKAQRFDEHRQAILLPKQRFHFVGVSQPEDLSTAEQGERIAIADFRHDPYGTGAKLIEKRQQRNPFNRAHTYASSCLELSDLLTHSGPHMFGGFVPWAED